MTPTWPMPPLANLAALCGREGDVLRLCCPLSPSQNVLQGWHWAKRGRYRDVCLPILTWQVNHLVSIPQGKAWARVVEISLVRCSTATVAADPSNLWAGLKGPIDCLVRSGLVPNDTPEHVRLGTVQDRPRGSWGHLPGPGSYIIIRRVS